LFEKTGAVSRRADGKPAERGNAPTPCSSCAKVPTYAKAAGMDWKELRRLAVEMTDQNREALRHYRECKATHLFPDDAIVKWYSGIIRAIEDEWQQEPAERQTAAILTLVTAVTLRWGR
jgi:hypothetical protein